MTETQERFLRTVLTRVPLDSVVELHLFPPIRRGTLETGVAVIATVMPVPPLAVHEDSATLEDVGDVVDPRTDAPDDEVASLTATDLLAGDGETLDAAEASVVAESTPGDDDAPDLGGAAADVESVASDDESLDAAAASEAVRVPPPSPRFRILTAGYRHTIKGLERGKWSVEVQEEADAPLEAVEAVLRGVRHRSTEPADPELVSHDALAALLAPGAFAPAA